LLRRYHTRSRMTENLCLTKERTSSLLVLLASVALRHWGNGNTQDQSG
jgi:hypothetical protein